MAKFWKIILLSASFMGLYAGQVATQFDYNGPEPVFFWQQGDEGEIYRQNIKDVSSALFYQFNSEGTYSLKYNTINWQSAPFILAPSMEQGVISLDVGPQGISKKNVYDTQEMNPNYQITAAYEITKDTFWTVEVLKEDRDVFRVVQMRNFSYNNSNNLKGYISSFYQQNFGLFVLRYNADNNQAELLFFNDNVDLDGDSYETKSFDHGATAMYVSRDYYYFLDAAVGKIHRYAAQYLWLGMDFNYEDKIDLSDLSIDLNAVNSFVIDDIGGKIIDDIGGKINLVGLAGEDGIYLYDLQNNLKHFSKDPAHNLQMAMRDRFDISVNLIDMGVVDASELTELKFPEVIESSFNRDYKWVKMRGSNPDIISVNDKFYLYPSSDKTPGDEGVANFVWESAWGQVEEFTVKWEYGNKPKLEVALAASYQLTVPEISPYSLPMTNGNSGVQSELYSTERDTIFGAQTSVYRHFFNLNIKGYYLLAIKANITAELPVKLTLKTQSQWYGEQITWEGFATAQQLTEGLALVTDYLSTSDQHQLILDFDDNDSHAEENNTIQMFFIYGEMQSLCKTYSDDDQIEMVCIPKKYQMGEKYNALLMVNDGVSTSMFETQIEVNQAANLDYEQDLVLQDIYLPAKAGTYVKTRTWLGRTFDTDSHIFDKDTEYVNSDGEPIGMYIDNGADHANGPSLIIKLTEGVVADDYIYYFHREDHFDNEFFSDDIPFKIIVVAVDPALTVASDEINVVQEEEATVNIQMDSENIFFNEPIIGTYEDIYSVDYVSDNNTIYGASSIIQTFETTTAKTLNHITIPIRDGFTATYTIVEYNEGFKGYGSPSVGAPIFEQKIEAGYGTTSITIPVNKKLEAGKTYALLIAGENDRISVYLGSEVSGATLWVEDYRGNQSYSDKSLAAYFDYSESYDWISVTGENNQWTATFAPDYSVTPGQYDLQVRTSTADGFFNVAKELTVTVEAPEPTINIVSNNYTVVVGSGKDSIIGFADIQNCPDANCGITVTSNSNNPVFTEIELSTDGTLTFSQNGKTGTDGFTVKACVDYNTHQNCSAEKVFKLSSVEKPVITTLKTPIEIPAVDSEKEGAIDIVIDGCGTEWSLCELSFSSESKNKLITNLQKGEGYIEYKQQPGSETFSVTVEACLTGTEICSEPQTITFNIVPAESSPQDSVVTPVDSLVSPKDTVPRLVGKFSIETTGLAMRALFPRNAGAKVALKYELQLTGLLSNTTATLKDTLIASSKDTMVWTGIPAGTWSAAWLVLHQDDTLQSGRDNFTIAAPVRQVASNTWTMLGLGQNSALWSQIDPQSELWLWDDSYAFGPYGGYKDRESFTKLNPGQGMWYYGPAWEMQNPLGEVQAVKVSLTKETTGWNMVANPFSWGVAPPQLSNSTCWSWENDEYVPAEVIVPFGACWVQVSKTQDYTFAPKAAFASATPVAPVALPKLTQNSQHNWVGQLALRAGKWKDSYNYIGVAAREQVGAKPPRAPNQKVALEIVHQNQKLHQHIRSAGSNAQWDLRIESALEIDATLQLDGIGHLARYGQAMVLKQGAQVQEVSPSQGAQLLLRKGENSAQLMVVPRTQLASLTQGLSGLRAQVVPQGLALSVEVPLALQGQTLTVEWVSLDGTVLARQKLTPASAGTVQVQMRAAQANSGLSLVRVRTASSSISATVMR